MSKNELVAKIEALNEWEAVIEEAKAEAEAIRDSIKAEMMERDTEEMTAGKYIVRWTSVLSNRFDTTAFKKAHGELYKEYTKQSASGQRALPKPQRRGQDHYSLPSPQNQEQERKRHERTDKL